MIRPPAAPLAAGAPAAAAAPLRPERRAIPAPAPSLLRRAAPLLLLAYIFFAFMPGVLRVGGLNFAPYKILIILIFVPMVLEWLSGRAGRITAPDILFLLFCLWMIFSFYLAVGIGRLPFLGSTFIDVFGAYLIGRVLIQDADDYRRFFTFFVWVLIIIFPFLILEALTRVRLLTNVMSIFLAIPESRLEEGGAISRPRLGLYRVRLGFGHPILFGVVCSIAIANVFYIFRGNLVKQFGSTAVVSFATFLSLSNGPLFSGVIQFVMMAWDRVLRILRARWVLFAVGGALVLAVLQLALPGGLIGYIVNELLFNPAGGHARILIWQYGVADVLRYPLFGLGDREWTRPFWLGTSIDNFWLVTALTSGLPALGFLLAAIGISCHRILRQPGLDEAESRYRSGYLIAMAGLVLSLCTVAIWEAATAVVMTYIGAGAWFYARQEPAREAPARVRRRRGPDGAGDTGGAPPGPPGGRRAAPEGPAVARGRPASRLRPAPERVRPAGRRLGPRQGPRPGPRPDPHRGPQRRDE